ncbi:PAS domain-containing protein [Acidocella aromatica]|uniref:PAS domain-containing protein n=1 Tax=Acidocella aromatica TaxID=1303579 RepID=A0A840VIR5_9PROT|nr:PAS domain-containing protein [Acidocella aromatica]MBB5373075.1 PAS domain-containing protein [Acidocella aromatica]
MTARQDGGLTNQPDDGGNWDDFISDLLVDVVDATGQIIWVNSTQAECLGLSPADMAGLNIEACYAPGSAEALRELFGRTLPDGFVTTLELDLAGQGGRRVRTLARCRKILRAGQPCFRLIKLNLGHVGRAYDDLQADNELFRRIIADASEAHWCIEFLEPVDINRAREEVVDQIFANRSIWRVANPAMMALYQLPNAGEFRSFDVRLYWPRTPENEAFVGQIIDANYHIDAGISSDRRHDGTTVNLENDVRAEIRETFLYRIWGNCRLVRPPAQTT